MSRAGTRSPPPQAAARRPGPAPFVRGPLPHHRPQIKGKATLRKGRRGWYLTYNFPTAFRLFEMGIVVPIPFQFTAGRVMDPALDGVEVEVVVRQYVNSALCDEPGVAVDEGQTLEDSESKPELKSE